KADCKVSRSASFSGIEIGICLFLQFSVFSFQFSVFSFQFFVVYYFLWSLLFLGRQKGEKGAKRRKKEAFYLFAIFASFRPFWLR
ncbi:MAG: hypothetical protein J2P41_04830, partial [Blastocatellia bacterium]|nr:hypothetical protein [Blastocatellia bacterium]